jgi:hypothetical protein
LERKIGLALVNVEMSQTPYGTHFNGASPSGYRRQGKKLCWIFRDIEPTEDICVRFAESPTLEGLSAEYGDYWTIDGRMMLDVDQCRGLHATKVGSSGRRSARLIECNGHTLKVTDGSVMATVDGRRTVRLAVPPGRTQFSHQFGVPVASVVRALGGEARFDRDTWTVHVRLPHKPRTKD